MKLQLNDREPIYLQIIRDFKRQVVLGTLQPGDSIPSRRELAMQLKVNANTVQRAYKEMEEEGMIKTVRNFPSKITEDNDLLLQLRHGLITEAVSEFVESMKAISVSKDEIIKIVEESYIEEGER